MQSMMSSFLTLKVEKRSANAIATNVNNEINPPNCVDTKNSTNDATTIDSPIQMLKMIKEIKGLLLLLHLF